MKLKSFILAMAALLTVSSCMKEGDFDELRHPFVIEGDFDPVLGLPLAKMTADMGDLVKMLDSSANLTLYIGENDLVTLRYYETQQETFDFRMASEKNRRKAPGDTIVVRNNIEGSVPISLFSKINELTDEGIAVNSILVTMQALLKGYVSDSLLALVDRGANVYFDSIALTVLCHDGYKPRIELADTVRSISLTELTEGKLVHIVNNYNCNYLVSHRPKSVGYSLRMNIEIPTASWGSSTISSYVDSLGVDSIASTFNTTVDFPMEVRCHNLTYVNTMEVDMASLDSLVNAVEEQLTLNDSASYLVFEAQNYIPVSMSFNTALLDESGNELVAHLFATDSTFAGAPVRRKAGTADMYESDGYTKSRIVMPIDMNLLKKLSKTKAMRYSITGDTSTPTKDDDAKVCIYKKDKMSLRAYIVVAPHVHLSLPLGDLL